MKPMLAGKISNLNDIEYPVIVTPKIDGIRCLISQDGAVSRTLKPIPSDFVRLKLNDLPTRAIGFDGELIVPGAKDFGTVSSAIMRRTSRARFEYHVFDVFNSAYESYIDRLDDLAKRMQGMPDYVKFVHPAVITEERLLIAYEEQKLAEGYEGIMLRLPNGPYKFGRSTVREGYLLKLKRFEDDEARVVGMVEELHNDNEITLDNLGHKKRSTHQANKTGKGSMGALLCKRLSDGVEFSIGTGFTLEQREKFWMDSDNVIGQIAKFKYQPSGGKDKPRFPVFLGFRHEDDM